MSAVSYVDSSALETLEHLNEDLAAAGVTLHLAEVKGPVMDRLRQTHLGQELAGQRIYLSTEHAFEALTAEP
jgi:SulP family sulfate permease